MNSDSPHSGNRMAAQILPLVALWAGGILAASIEVQYCDQVEWHQLGEAQVKADDRYLAPAGRSPADAARLFAGEAPRTDWSKEPQSASLPERCALRIVAELQPSCQQTSRTVRETGC